MRTEISLVRVFLSLFLFFFFKKIKIKLEKACFCISPGVFETYIKMWHIIKGYMIFLLGKPMAHELN